MKRKSWFYAVLLCGLPIGMAGSGRAVAGPPPGAASAFDAYAGRVEARLGSQHKSQAAFLASAAMQEQDANLLWRGEPVVEELTPAAGEDVPGGQLHHWRGTAFIKGAHAADFVRLMQDFNGYPRYFVPQVLRARVLVRRGDDFQITMRVRQKRVITVVMDTAYDVRFGRLDPGHGYSISRSTRITEIDNAGTAAERELDAKHEHGFLWRLNTYWSYEERDGGLYVQIETVSLSRAIPRGLGWIVGPFVESVPRESMEFSLRAACNALRH